MLGHAGTILGIGVGVWQLSRLGGRQTIKGFQVRYLPGLHAATVLDPAPAELNLPLAAFNDGKYARARAILVRLDVMKNDNVRILAASKGAYKGKNASDARFEGVPFRYQELPMDITGGQQTLTVKLPALADGDYAVAFRFEDDLLPRVFDFMVR